MYSDNMCHTHQAMRIHSVVFDHVSMSVCHAYPHLAGTQQLHHELIW